MVTVIRLRISAFFCAVTLVICELVSRPFAELGIADDWSYIRTAQLLARTGHIVYNGWAAAIVGWQLFIAAGLVRAFGFSFTTVRMSTLLVSVATAFLMQRTFVRASISERNAIIGTLAVVLSPIYMMLSVTFMTDIGGLFAVVACTYGCLGALLAATSKRAVGWICFAVLVNAICGTSRQIAWLGVLVMVPCTLWLLRDRRSVIVVGGMAMLTGWGFVAFCMRWFSQQPYSLQEHLLVEIAGLHQAAYMARELLRASLEIPFLILPLTLAFLPQIRRYGWRGWFALFGGGIGYTLLALRMAKGYGATAMLQPLLRDWIGQQGFYQYAVRAADGPVVLSSGVRLVLTAMWMAGLCGVAIFLLCSPKLPVRDDNPAPQHEIPKVSWNQLGCLLLPFAVVYFALLIPRSRAWVLDRYLLEFEFVGAVCLCRAFQEFVRPSLPVVTSVLVGLTALFSIGCTHDMFAAYRARVTLASEMQAVGVPNEAFDEGFEFNYDVELSHAGHINDERLTNPPGSYIPVDKYRGFTCNVRPVAGTESNMTPEERFAVELKQETDPRLLHFMPLYGTAYTPDACRGSTSILPATYFRWLGFKDTTIYVVKYGPR